ncbi:hypothetical protein N5U03_08005 [Aliarcobacter butzleri]|nr:hypothetical protein [Aliarcobacter butzleri]
MVILINEVVETIICQFVLDYHFSIEKFGLKIPHMKLMIFSVMFLFVFSRLFGMGSFWRQVMKDNFVYEVKAMIEEGTELLAYGLILYSAYLIYKYLVNEKI